MATNLTVEAMCARADDLNIYECSDQFPVPGKIDDLVRARPAADIIPCFTAETVDKNLNGLSFPFAVLAGLDASL